jgi:hypothetical protein
VKGGVFLFFFKWHSFGYLGAHAKFQNRSLPLSGNFWLVGEEEGGGFVDIKGFLSHR